VNLPGSLQTAGYIVHCLVYLVSRETRVSRQDSRILSPYNQQSIYFGKKLQAVTIVLEETTNFSQFSVVTCVLGEVPGKSACLASSVRMKQLCYCPSVCLITVEESFACMRYLLCRLCKVGCFS